MNAKSGTKLSRKGAKSHLIPDGRVEASRVGGTDGKRLGAPCPADGLLGSQGQLRPADADGNRGGKKPPKPGAHQPAPGTGKQRSRPLRILVVDDHELVRRGLRAVLLDQSGWQVCGEAANGKEAVELALQLRPDVVVMDLSMPELNGLEATRRIRKALPDVEVLILSVHESEQMVGEALSAGARGYILKADTSRLLIAAIEALSRRKPFFTGEIAQMMLGWYLKAGKSLSGQEQPRMRLTSREREVIQLLAEGRTNKEVASTLNLCLKTVDAHRSNLMRKLNLKSVTGLVRYAIRNQIIQA